MGSMHVSVVQILQYNHVNTTEKISGFYACFCSSDTAVQSCQQLNWHSNTKLCNYQLLSQIKILFEISKVYDIELQIFKKK